ncbi:hypothetical protein PHLCEN_2v258 [Hermanssonia centrifuga]|uniref:Uncharacterized protein n=1 Tax=Hermanssonia centrifuga TaxID=98765 RepID=A0A2R6S6H8_9APHY|nr:hypothetical protein PHLCEN_2v258 [Hermanssonia centrifuga]
MTVCLLVAMLLDMTTHDITVSFRPAASLAPPDELVWVLVSEQSNSSSDLLPSPAVEGMKLS